MDNRSYSTIIAGITGSGKSWIINDTIRQLKGNPDVQFVLIDPKKVELNEYKSLPQTLYYANDPDSIYDALMDTYDIMNRRYDDMVDQGIKNSKEPHIFIVVDEMAALMNSSRKKEYAKVLSDIAMLGRAAHVHMILCTQVATQDVIPAFILNNTDNKVCLRQRNAQKYRYILEQSVPRLPMYGYAYVMSATADRPEKVKAEDVWKKIAG